jgi:preprotein translocase subunit SecG
MLVVFGILVILASVILGFIVLVQNPKGGGLSGTFGGVGTQIMGVKQTTDILEKGTWIFAGVVAILCITSPLFIPKSNTVNEKKMFEKVNPQTTQPAAPKTTAPATAPASQPAAAPTGKPDSAN